MVRKIMIFVQLVDGIVGLFEDNFMERVPVG